MATGRHSKGRHSLPPQQAQSRPAQPLSESAQAYSRSARSYSTPPQRPPRNKSKSPIVILVVFVVLVICAGAFIGLHACDKGVTGEVREGEQITVEVPSGSSTESIGILLVENGVIGSSNEFVNSVKQMDAASSLQAGTYEFTGGQPIEEIVEIIASGKTAGLTIPEGFTLKQIAERVSQETGIDYDEFYKLVSTGAGNYASEYPFLKDAYQGSMEGFLFPATYEIGANPTADGLVRQMLDKYQEQFSTIDMSYAKSKNLTEYDVVTLAAMIEKESRSSDDKADISAVFYNRLREGITLGSDVTTYYAVGKDLTEELTQEDLNSDSPYNTRNPHHYGLPAGPICSPGMEALKAAAQPSQAGYLYFFWSASQNKTMFFDTLDEFNKAWDEYGA